MEAERQKQLSRFNWVSLLFVVLLLAIGGGCLVAGMGSAREAGRRTVCQNNMRNVSTALINYENSRNRYPGYANVLMTKDGKVNVDVKTGKKPIASWTILIMHQMDRPDLDAAWKTSSSQATAETESAKQTPMEIFICPSDPRAGQGGMLLSYVVNCGMKDCPGSATMPRDWEGNGVFFDRFTNDPRVADDSDILIPMVKMSSAFIARNDGLQNTILVTENVDAGNYTDTDETQIGVLWNPAGTIDTTKNPPHLAPLDPNMKMNAGAGLSKTKGGSAIFARPSSLHPDGVNVVFCDCHLKYLSDKIDYYVYCQLMSTSGSHVREPGSDARLPGFDVDVKDEWLDP